MDNSPTKSIMKNNAPKEKSKNKSFFNIDQDMWRFKLHYFLFIGGIGASFPFIPDYAKNQIGISTTALAMILMIQQFLFVVTKPAIGYLADYFNKLKALIVTLTVLQGISFFAIIFIPKIHYIDTASSFTALCYNSYDDESCTILTNSSTPAEYFLRNYTFEIITDPIKDISEIYYSKDYTESNSTETLNLLENMDETCHVLQFRERGKSQCGHCLLTGTIDCHCVYACSPTEKYCLCSSLNTKISSEQELNDSGIAMKCECFEEKKCYGISTVNFQKSSNSSLSIINKKRDIYTYQFWLFALVHTFGMMCNNAMFTLSDTACCESVEKAGAQFGRQRLWGAIGWGAMAPVAGILNDFTRSYFPAWILMELFFVIAVWNILNLDLCKPQFSKNILKDVGKVLKSAEFLTFEAGLLMNGIGAAMVWYYLILFLISIGSSKLLCGLSLTIQSCVGNIPFMFFSGSIINKLGPLNVVSLALLMYTVRFLWYGFLWNPWYVLFVESLHGLTYGLLYTNIASYGKMSAKPGTEATTHAILFSTHEGLGAGLGCVFGGLGLDYLGGRSTFIICSIFTACGLVLHQIATHLVRRRNRTIKLNSPPSILTVQQYI